MAAQRPKKGRKEFATCHRLWPSFGPWWAATATRSGTGLPETGGPAVAVGDIGLLSVARGCSVRDIGGGRSIAQKPRGWRQIAGSACIVLARPDRTSVVSGKRVSVRVDLGGCRFVKKKKDRLH